MPYLIAGVTVLLSLVAFFSLRKRAKPTTSTGESFVPIFPTQRTSDTYRSDAELK